MDSNKPSRGKSGRVRRTPTGATLSRATRRRLMAMSEVLEMNPGFIIDRAVAELWEHESDPRVTKRRVKFEEEWDRQDQSDAL